MDNEMLSFSTLFERRKFNFSEEEINRINNLKVAIAGAGTLGGSIAMSFARIGIKELRIVDPEDFEPANICKQFGATIDTVGTNKAFAVKEAIHRINPFIQVRAFDSRLSQVPQEQFFGSVDLVVDAIEFFSIDEVRELYHGVVRRKIWCFTGQAAGSYISIIEYSPEDGPTWFDLFQDSGGNVDIYKMALALFPPIKKNLSTTDLQQFLKFPNEIPTSASIPLVGPGLVFEEIVNVAIRKRTPRALAPNLLLADLDSMSIRKEKI